MARVEQTLADRYELLDVLGRGGMGVVYRARDLKLDRIVAVKMLPAALAEVGNLIERFEREARAAARLNHPNIVAVFDTGTDRGARYIVMECVPGESLAQRLSARGRLAVPEAIDIAAQVASALAAAHAAGIIHRDIKPGNVMVQPSGTAKVLDFGIARATADAALTNTTTLLGSAPYMAPEVALGQPADARSDIYSLGCVLYEMLAGRPPFLGDLPVAVMNQQVSATPRPLREFDAAIPAAVEILVMQMLAKRPEDRPQQAAALVTALRESLQAEAPETAAITQQLAPPPIDQASPATARRRTRPPQPIPPPRPSGGRPWIILLALIVALIAGAAVAVAIVNSAKSGRSSSTSSSTQAPTTPSTRGGGQAAPSRSTTTSRSSTTQSHSTPSTASTANPTTSTPTTSTGAGSTTSSTRSSSTPASTTTTPP